MKYSCLPRFKGPFYLIEHSIETLSADRESWIRYAYGRSSSLQNDENWCVIPEVKRNLSSIPVQVGAFLSAMKKNSLEVQCFR